MARLQTKELGRDLACGRYASIWDQAARKFLFSNGAFEHDEILAKQEPSIASVPRQN